MQTAPAALPDDIDALKAALLAARVELAQVRAEAAVAAADLTALTALIAHQKLMIEKLKRDKFGPSSERTARLIDQMEFELEEMYPSGENRLAGLNLAFDSSDVFKCVAKDRGVGDHQRG